MINHYLIQKALRAKLLTFALPTTGSAQISATTSGYARASGSFLTDGFTPGMEVTGTGFSTAANNTAKTITSVTATAMLAPGCAVEAAATRTLTVNLPLGRAWENVKYEPTTKVPWVEENYLPGGMEKTSLGPLGELEALPLYVVKIYVPQNTGIGAARTYADQLITLFAPGTSLTVAGHTVTVRTVPTTYAGQLIQTESGFGVIPVTVPIRVRTANSI